jgi:hypothetical protein
MAKLVKLTKTDQIVDVIKKIKGLKSDEVVFEFPTGSPLFKNPHNFSLIKKSAGAMGKTVIVRTSDPSGMSMAAKAGLLTDDTGVPVSVPTKTITKKVKFKDIGSNSLKRPSVAATSAAPARFQTIHPRVSSAGRDVVVPHTEPSGPKFKLKFPSVSSNFSKFFVLAVVVLILLVFGVAVLLPQAQITVYARSEPIVRDFEISVATETRTVNPDTLTVPGIEINKEVSHTKNFPATGVKLSGNKATGSVQLYNFTKNTLTLRAATTTLTLDGKRYSFAQDVTGLRPTARIGQGGEQEIDESSLIPPIAIVAQEVGADYNVGADLRMNLQNAALGEADVYAETVGAISGGSSTETKVVSQQDIDNATQAIQEELAGLAEKELAEDPSNSGLKILPNAVETEVLAKTANREVDEAADTFDMTIIARVAGIGFNETDVKELMVDKINTVLSEDKYLLDDGRDRLNATFKAVDIAAGTGVLAVNYRTTAAYRVENSNLSSMLAGKNAMEIQEILLTRPEIDRVDVLFSPFFVNKAPRYNGKIYINTLQSN